MKNKNSRNYQIFWDPVNFFCWCYFLIHPPILTMIGIFGLIYFAVTGVENYSVVEAIFLIGVAALCAIGSPIAFWYIYQKDGSLGFAFLKVYPDKITWMCPAYKSVTMYYDEMKYIKIEDCHKSAYHAMEIRGDESTYIYMSDTPYPADYIGLVASIKCKKGTIRFKYSDKLCEELVKRLPDDKCISLKVFYHKMKARDEHEKKRKEKEKSKKLRKKQIKQAKREKERIHKLNQNKQ